MDNVFQMVTRLWYHILLQLVPVCCFISVFAQVVLGLTDLKFLSYSCTDGTQQVRKSSSALHLLTTEEQRVSSKALHSQDQIYFFFLTHSLTLFMLQELSWTSKISDPMSVLLIFFLFCFCCSYCNSV